MFEWLQALFWIFLQWDTVCYFPLWTYFGTSWVCHLEVGGVRRWEGCWILLWDWFVFTMKGLGTFWNLSNFYSSQYYIYTFTIFLKPSLTNDNWNPVIHLLGYIFFFCFGHCCNSDCERELISVQYCFIRVCVVSSSHKTLL